jgi:hypothetical protein
MTKVLQGVGGMAELSSPPLIHLKGPMFKTWWQDNFLKRSKFRKLFRRHFKSESSSMINPELVLSFVLMKVQHVQASLHVGCSICSVVKVNSNTYTSLNMNSQYNTHL